MSTFSRPVSYKEFGTLLGSDTSTTVQDQLDAITALLPSVVEGALTSAQILGMYDTPVVVIPGVAGKTPIVLGVQLYHNYSTTQYTDGGDVFLATYDEDLESVETLVTLIDKTIITEQGVNTETYIVPSAYDLDASTGTSKGPLLDIPGVGICISNSTAAFAAGNASNILYYRIWYKYIDNYTT